MNKLNIILGLLLSTALCLSARAKQSTNTQPSAQASAAETASAEAPNDAASTEAPNKEKQEINYGDPTAVYKSVGASVSDSKAVQANFIYGHGKNIVQFDYTRQYQDRQAGDGTEGWGYRGRYFYVNDGLGFNLDVIGSHNQNVDSTMAVVGAMYKVQVTDNIMLFPMINVGRSFTKFKGEGLADFDTGIVQPALYALYAFDDGHWLYANPRYSYATSDPTNLGPNDYFDRGSLEVELGGGYMLNEWSALEFKVEYTTDNNTRINNRKVKDDTVSWLKYALYF